MDLKDLQATWQKISSTENFPQEQLDKKMLKEILKRKSHNALESIRRNIWLEGSFNAVFAGVSLFLFFWEDAFTLRVIFASFVVYGLGLGIYLYQKYTLLTRLGSPEIDLQSYLFNLSRQLRKFLLVYQYSNSLLASPALIAGFVLGAYYNQKQNLVLFLQKTDHYTLILIASTFLVAIVAGHFFAVWFAGNLYGKHLKRIEQCCEELADN